MRNPLNGVIAQFEGTATGGNAQVRAKSANGGFAQFETYDDVTIVSRLGDGGSGSDLGIMSLYDTGTEDIRLYTGGDSWINGNGNLGIGTTAPNTKLVVAQETAFSYPTMGQTKGAVHVNPVAATNDDTVALTFGANNLGAIIDSGQAGIYVRSSSVYGTKMYFGTTNSYATGSQSRMMIDHVGNVGIGTTAPATKFHMSSGTLLLDGTGAAINVVGPIVQAGRTVMQYASITTVAGTTYQIAAGGDLDAIYELNFSAAGYNDYKKIILTSRQYDQGNIVILASNNYQDNAIISNIRMTGNADLSTHYLLVDVSLAGTLQARASGISTGLSLTSSGYGTTAATNKVSILSDRSGNVGIGTTSPTSLLYVNGNAFVNGTLTATTISGSVSGNATTATALAANGGNCTAGSFPLGVDASGAVETCTTATTGNVVDTGDTMTGTLTNSAATGLSLTNATSNLIVYNSAGVAAPTFTSRSAGTKIVLYPNVGASSADYALGIEGSTLWASVPTTASQFKWYGGTSQAMLLTGAGALTATSFSGNGAGLTSLTGANVSGNISGNAANVTGTVAVANGGTGGTTAATARTGIGLSATGSTQIHDHTGTYTSLDISGSANAYSGLHFTDVTGNGGYMMVHNTGDIQGFYNGSAWSWYFDDGVLSAGTVPGTRVTGNITGNAGTATALAANGADCAAGSFPLGVNASGAVESCTTTTTGNVADTGDTMTGTLTMNTAATALTTTGKVGIGTTVPAAKLHISSGSLIIDGNAGDITNRGILYQQTFLGQGSGAHGISFYSPAYTTWFDYMAPPGTTNSPTGTAAASDSTSGVTSWARRFNIESSANYGWVFESGTNGAGNAPTVKFSINSNNGNFHATGNGTVDGSLTAASFSGGLSGNATTATALAANGANCAAGSFPLGVNASGAVETCTTTTTGNVDVTGDTMTGTLTMNTAATALTTTGNVGIGTTAPTALLDVNGNFKATGQFTGSSRKMKKDFEKLAEKDFQEILKTVKQLQLVKYRYKNQDTNETKTLGVIAEDAPKELLNSQGDALNNTTYMSYAIAAIKAQQELIEKLNGMIESLSSRISRLEKGNQ